MHLIEVYSVNNTPWTGPANHRNHAGRVEVFVEDPTTRRSPRAACQSRGRLGKSRSASTIVSPWLIGPARRCGCCQLKTKLLREYYCCTINTVLLLQQYCTSSTPASALPRGRVIVQRTDSAVVGLVCETTAVAFHVFVRPATI